MSRISCFAVLLFLLLTRDAIAQRGWVPERDDPIEICKRVRLALKVDGMIRPILLAKSLADRARRLTDSTFDALFVRLMEDSSMAGVEARVALMAYYMGSAAGEALLVEARRDYQRADPLILRYQACRPPGSFEDDIPSIPVIRRLYWMYRQ
jgi:hypothetical protein